MAEEETLLRAQIEKKLLKKSNELENKAHKLEASSKNKKVG